MSIHNEVTPGSKKTYFGKVPDFYRASNEMDEQSIGKLFNDIANYEDNHGRTAHEVARAFHEDDAEKYNKNQMVIRETAKEEVDKHSQPEWAWDLLSVYSEDLGKRLLDVPSDGSSKGLLIDENYETAFLYSKKADGISAVDHINRWYDNGLNAQSLGYELPAENLERTALDIGDHETGEPVLAMDYNGEMVLDSKIDEFLEDKFSERADEKEKELQDRKSWVKDAQRNREKFLEGKNVENVDDWVTGLEFLIDNDYLENWGVEEYKRGKDNTAVDPVTLDRVMVDLGEYRDEEGEEEEEFNKRPGLGTTDMQGIVPEENSSRNRY